MIVAGIHIGAVSLQSHTRRTGRSNRAPAEWYSARHSGCTGLSEGKSHAMQFMTPSAGDTGFSDNSTWPRSKAYSGSRRSCTRVACRGPWARCPSLVGTRPTSTGADTRGSRLGIDRSGSGLPCSGSGCRGGTWDELSARRLRRLAGILSGLRVVRIERPRHHTFWHRGRI